MSLFRDISCVSWLHLSPRVGGVLLPFFPSEQETFTGRENRRRCRAFSWGCPDGFLRLSVRVLPGVPRHSCQ